MIGTLNSHEIEEVLSSQLIARIGCHSNGITYVVPVSYAYDGTYVYCHTHDGMKVRMMRENPAVCFEVDAMENMANWKSVISWGLYEELTDKEERKKGIQKLLNRVLPVITSQTVKISPHWPFPPGDDEQVKGIVFRILLKEKTGKFEKDVQPSYYAT